MSGPGAVFGAAGGIPDGSGDSGSGPGGRGGAGRVGAGGPGGAGRGAGGTPAPMPLSNAEAKEPTAQVLMLKYAQAQDMQATLSVLLNARSVDRTPGSAPISVTTGNRVKIASDARTNSLIVIADDETLKMVKELIEKLDVLPPTRGK